MEDSRKFYPIVLENDKSLKQLFDRFYVIPKDFSIIAPEDKIIFDKYQSQLANKLVAQGKNGYIVFRGKKPKKLTQIQVDEIRSDTVSTQRELAFKYDVGVDVINRIKNNKY